MKQRQHSPGQPRRIVGFHLDERLDWVAELECGHQQHVRHNPPWTAHHWVTTAAGRSVHIGHALPCVACSLVGLASWKAAPRD
jgi:hypothetical protein